MTVEIIRELPTTSSGAEQVLVKKDERYFVVSSVIAMFGGFETLVFPGNADGEVTDWGEVAGGRGQSRQEAINDLDRAEFSEDGERKW